MRGARDGVSAVEFAILAPVMITMWLGTAEVGSAVGASWKTKLVARTMADLAARTTIVTNQGMANIFDATSAVVYPYDVKMLSMRLTSIKRSGSGASLVVWSDVSPGSKVTARPTGSSVTVPPGILNNTGETVIFAETFYRYKPISDWVINKGIFTLTGDPNEQYFPINYEFFMTPRLAEVVRSP